MIKTVLLTALLMFYVDCGGRTANLLPSDPPATPRTGSRPEYGSPATITLERTQCFGSCPAYKLTINADGTTIFEGEKYTEMTGRQEGKIDKAAYERLLREFDNANFLELKDNYDDDNCPLTSTDASTAIVTFLREGKTKTVRHYLGCSDNTDQHGIFPAELYDLEKTIDVVAKTDQWIKK